MQYIHSYDQVESDVAINLGCFVQILWLHHFHFRRPHSFLGTYFPAALYECPVRYLPLTATACAVGDCLGGCGLVGGGGCSDEGAVTGSKPTHLPIQMNIQPQFILRMQRPTSHGKGVYPKCS